MFLAASCTGVEDGEALLVAELGGDTTAFTDTRNAFSLPARNLSGDERRVFAVGNSFFRTNWVAAPASTEARDGLGPLFNAFGCSSCHFLDGRAKPPEGVDDPELGLLIRISMPGVDAHGGPLAHPTYGDQVQDRAILGVEPEALIVVSWEEVPGAYEDGTAYSLRRPTFRLVDPAYGPLPDDLLLSPRIAQQIVGMGLLEAIPEERLLEFADPDDEDGDGISGRVNRVWNAATGEETLGRFGWKAGQPTVETQVAAAFLNDVGITSPVLPDENCSAAQIECLAAINGGSPEMTVDRLAAVTLYTQTLAVPAMRNLEDEAVERGAALFFRAGCDACHTPSHQTGDASIAALSNQTILPYTDLLLHDMGEGLADGRPEFDASGSEWRTPPLWGIGLIQTVNGHTMLLHDGRARSIEEAILWHGGEGAGARDAFRALSSEEREALLQFLESL